MLKIYGRKNSSNVQKVLWCCGELGLAYERLDMGRQFGGNDQPEYLALNPTGLIPTIIDGGQVIWESNTILRYLSAKYGAGTLFPDDPGARAVGEKWMDWQLSVMHPTYAPMFYGLIRTPPEERDMAAIAASRDATAAVFAQLDRYLGETDYLGGDEFTVADISLGIYAYRWYQFDIEREEMGNLERWYGRLTERPAYREHVMIGVT